MSIAEVVVGSLGDLIDKVTPIEPDPRTGRRRDTGIYRGASDACRPLLTSLDRLGGVNPPHTKRELEAHILRNFIRYSRPHLAAAPVNEWEVLVAAQHHGVPTRLLDWTYSPLVAAHFATTDAHAGRDRAVWRLDWQQVHRAFKLPKLALLIEDLARTFGSEDRPFTLWTLFATGTAAGARADLRDFACMIEPPSLDARIIAQAAVFTLCTDTSRSFDAFLEAHGLASALTKFVIPESEAARFRDQLDLVGIDERRVFPDLDGVAEGLRRYYS
ncbi:MAG: FRG domain-containing protein [Gemmatimonadota bacterium]|nr:FRG domain-containing protein [Gemmatimonadota bacterium]